MNQINRISGADKFMYLFKTEISIARVILTGFSVNANGFAYITFDLIELPAIYPERWLDFNKVAVNLVLTRPTILSLQGSFLKDNCIVGIELIHQSEEVCVKIYGDDFNARIDADFISFEKIYPY